MKITKTASGKQTIKISKKEWTNIGKTAGWMKTTKKISDCCGIPDRKCEPDRGMTNNFYSDIDMCPKCKKHCNFVEN